MEVLLIDDLLLLLGVALFLWVYFIPSIIAQGKKNAGWIFVLNLFFGATGWGWIFALIWALNTEEITA